LCLLSLSVVAWFSPRIPIYILRPPPRWCLRRWVV
jgi:hypothetical protein